MPRRGDKQPKPPPDDITTPVVSSGFTNIEAASEVVTAQIEHEYHAPTRSDVHITTGPGDTTGDGDQDGLSDAAEAKYGTNPHDYDSDRDGVADGVEVQIGTDPLNKLGDADGDGVPDATEIGQGMNPFDPDTDHDGISDAVEYDRYPFLATVPTPGSTDTDWDGDGLSNEVEDMYGHSRTIPERNVPEFQALRDADYQKRLDLQPDPVQQAIIATDLQRELTPAQESALLDAVYERGIESDNPFQRYALAAQIEVIDGTPIPTDVQEAYDRAVAERDQATRDAMPNATLQDVLAVKNQIYIGAVADPAVRDAADARLTAIKDLSDQVLRTGDPRALMQLQIAVPGVSLTTDEVTTLSDGIGAMDLGASSGGGSDDASAPKDTWGKVEWDGRSFVPVVEATAPTAGDGAAPSAPGSSDASDLPSPVPDAPAAAPASGSTTTATSTEFVPDNTASQAADNLGGFLDGIAGELAAAAPKSDIDMNAMVSGQPTVSGTVTTGTTEDGRTYTQTDQGAQGFKREYDDTGTVQFFNPDGTPKGGELHLHSDAGSTDGTNPYEGTTDDDEEAPPEEEEEDDGTGDGTLDDAGGTAVAYVNPDADVITVGLAPVVAQLIVTGNDPATTTPSGPYVDDDVAPVVVTSGVVQIGLATPMNPGVVDGNPDVEVISGSRVMFDPDGPDVISPDDPLIGSGAGPIDADDLSPRPSTTASGGLMGEGPGDDSFDPI